MYAQVTRVPPWDFAQKAKSLRGGATIKSLMLSLISVVRNSVGFPLDARLSPMNPYKLIVGLTWLA